MNMKHLMTLAALPAVLLAPSAFADETQTLRLQNFIGTVNITTGERFDVSGKTDGITETREGGLIIDGNQAIDNSHCKTTNGNINISIGKKSWFKQIGGYKDIKDYPNLYISVPPSTHLDIADSVIFGTGETFGSVDAHINSCGSLEIGDVSGPVELKVSGSGDFKAGTVGEANVRISGSGDVTLGDMEMAILKVSGSGDLDGGDIVGPAKITTSGSGDIDIGRLIGALIYEGRGSSELSIETVTGSSSITLSGSGDVEIDDGKIAELLITSRGSGEFEFGGRAGNVTALSSGSGNIEIADATGTREVKTSGSATVKIGSTRYDH